MTYLTDDEIRWDAGQQEHEWHGASGENCRPAVTECRGTNSGKPRQLAGLRGSPDPLHPTRPEGGAVAMMQPPRTDRITTPRREAPASALSVITTPPEPSLAEWRARCLLALSLVNHRRTDDGLSDADTTAVRGALMGEWDVA